MRAHAADLTAQKLAAAAPAVASGAGAVLAGVKGWVLELLGVPLPVLLAAATGAFGARVLLPEAPFWRALGASVFWTLAGAYGVEFGLWVASSWISAPPPLGALAGGAMFIAGVGQRLGPDAIKAARARIQQWGGK